MGSVISLGQWVKDRDEKKHPDIPFSTCRFCLQDKASSDCTRLAFKTADGSFELRTVNDWNEQCGKCKAGPWKVHHSDCLMEFCPICSDQVMSCSCNVDY